MVVGVDIGSFSLKLCVLKLARKGSAVQSLSAVPWPESTWADGVWSHPAVISDHLKDLLKKSGIGAKNVALAVAGPDTFCQRFRLPPMKPAEVGERVLYEAEQWAPFDLAHAYFDYAIVDSKRTDAWDVVVTAARPSVVESAMSVLSNVGLKVISVEPVASASTNALQFVHPEVGSKSVLLIDVGGAYFRLSLVQQGVLVYCREVPTAGIYLTQEISRRLGLSIYEAEVLKQGGGPQNIVPKEVIELMLLLLENLAAEAKRTVDMYRKTHGDFNPAEAYLTGGSAKIPQLSRVFSEVLKIPIRPLVPVHGLATTYPEEYLAELNPIGATAVGLALRNPKEAKQRQGVK